MRSLLMAAYEFDVIGVPTPQGSKQAFVRGGRAVVVDAGSQTSRNKHAQWRAAVAQRAQEARNGALPLSGPVAVEMRFWMPLVKSDPHRSRHTTTPDLDKLIRAVLDSLTNSAIIADDSLVYSVDASKFYARNGHFTGVSVVILDMSGPEDSQREHSKLKASAAKRASKLAG